MLDASTHPFGSFVYCMLVCHIHLRTMRAGRNFTPSLFHQHPIEGGSGNCMTDSLFVNQLDLTELQYPRSSGFEGDRLKQGLFIFPSQVLMASAPMSYRSQQWVSLFQVLTYNRLTEVGSQRMALATWYAFSPSMTLCSRYWKCWNSIFVMACFKAMFSFSITSLRNTPGGRTSYR